MYKKILLIIIGFSALVWVAGCEGEDIVCPDTQVYNFKLSLIREVDSTTTRLKIYYPNDNADSIELGKSLSPDVEIPVDISSDSTVFFIEFITQNDSVNIKETDTIAFTYLSNVTLTNQECGFIMDFEILKIYRSMHHIDSVFWINNLINNDNKGNLEIYY